MIRVLRVQCGHFMCVSLLDDEESQDEPRDEAQPWDDESLFPLFILQVLLADVNLFFLLLDHFVRFDPVGFQVSHSRPAEHGERLALDSEVSEFRQFLPRDQDQVRGGGIGGLAWRNAPR